MPAPRRRCGNRILYVFSPLQAVQRQELVRTPDSGRSGEHNHDPYPCAHPGRLSDGETTVLDVVYIVAILAVFGVVALVAWGVGKL